MPQFKVEEGGRADKVVAARLPGHSRQELARGFAGGLVRVNGRKVKKGDLVWAGDVVDVADGIGAPAYPAPEPGPLSVLYQDEALVAVDKPAGPPSHPLRAGELGTLANVLVARFPECAGAGGDAREAGLAHRLDAGTSGVLVAARSREVWTALRAAFTNGHVTKEYLALVVGVVTRAGTIDAAIAQVQGGRVATVCEDLDEAAGRHARRAVTRFEPVLAVGEFTLLRCHAETGRMHQVRVHLAHLGTPVVGDATYGIRVAGAPALPVGHFLHAARLTLPHPSTGAPLDLAAPLPAPWLAAVPELAPVIV